MMDVTNAEKLLLLSFFRLWFALVWRCGLKENALLLSIPVPLVSYLWYGMCCSQITIYRLKRILGSFLPGVNQRLSEEGSRRVVVAGRECVCVCVCV
jgi:hypothetical protein